MRIFALLAATACGVLVAGQALAAFPEKPITLVVPFPPGGSVDTQLRQLAVLASKELGKPIVLETKTGASGSVALSGLKNDAPDGYRLSVLVPTSLRLPMIQPMNYDPLKDFTYISMLARITYVVTVPESSPYKTWQDLLADARANPGKLNYGNAGIYSSMHLQMEQVADKEGVTWNAVPYKGDGDQVQELAGGRLDFAVPSMGGVAPMVDAGKARLLAIFSDKRTVRYPDIPTLREAGTDMVGDVPYGIVGPAGMSPDVVKILSDAFRKASAKEENRKTLVQLGLEEAFSSPEEFAEWAQITYRKEREVIDRLEEKGGSK